MVWIEAIFFTAVTFCVVYLLVMSAYQMALLLIYRATRGPDPDPARRFADDELPRVTVQLPVYNEGELADQCLRLAADLDYPHDRLQIQYLDDSDDGVTSDIARATVDRLRRERPDLDIQYLKRGDRSGFKAGALKYGTERANGEFLAIFDADFLIPRDFLRQTLHHFTDPSIGIVQARWDYTNADRSVFCRLQANKLDMHQMVEQSARAKIGAQAIFHGTAGVWRATALAEAGGWNCMSEVEDVELTIRSAASGRRMIYLDRLRIASELPETVRGYVRQQMRWKRGWTRVTLHYSRTVLNGPNSWRHKLDVLQRIHLSWGPLGALVMTLAVLPYFMVAARLGLVWPAIALYIVSLVMSLIGRVLESRTLAEDPWPRGPMKLPPLLRHAPLGYLMNLGMAWPLTQATLEGFGKGQVWEVTPKSGTTAGSVGHGGGAARRPLYVWGTLGTGAIGFAMAIISLLLGHPLAAFFYVMLVVGCGWIGGALWIDTRPPRPRPESLDTGTPEVEVAAVAASS
ncbi:MAG: glycosyltransferase [Planctomycetota bacterium]